MSDSSIDALIAEGRRIHSAATPGTWHAWDRGVGWMIALDPDGNTLLPEGTRTDLDRREDAEAIAWDHNHLPGLLDMLEQWREIARDRRDELVIARARIAELEDERDEALGRLDIERSRIQAAEYGAAAARETRNRMAGKLRAARVRVAELEATPDVPEAWSNLIAAIRLLAKHPADRERPFHCEHDTLHVLADDSKFTAEEIARLSEWDFDVDSSEGGFYSFRYGSA